MDNQHHILIISRYHNMRLADMIFSLSHGTQYRWCSRAFFIRFEMEWSSSYRSGKALRLSLSNGPYKKARAIPLLFFWVDNFTSSPANNKKMSVLMVEPITMLFFPSFNSKFIKQINPKSTFCLSVIAEKQLKFFFSFPKLKHF